MIVESNTASYLAVNSFAAQIGSDQVGYLQKSFAFPSTAQSKSQKGR